MSSSGGRVVGHRASGEPEERGVARRSSHGKAEPEARAGCGFRAGGGARAWLALELDNLEQGARAPAQVFQGPSPLRRGSEWVHRPGCHTCRSSRTLAKAAVALFHPRLRRAGGQRGWRPVSRGLCREAGRWPRGPGQKDVRPLPRTPPRRALLPGGGVPVLGAAAVREEADAAAQDGEQAGAPAQVEGRAQTCWGSGR